MVDSNGCLIVNNTYIYDISLFLYILIWQLKLLRIGQGNLSETRHYFILVQLFNPSMFYCPPSINANMPVLSVCVMLYCLLTIFEIPSNVSLLEFLTCLFFTFKQLFINNWWLFSISNLVLTGIAILTCEETMILFWPHRYNC